MVFVNYFLCTFNVERGLLGLTDTYRPFRVGTNKKGYCVLKRTVVDRQEWMVCIDEVRLFYREPLKEEYFVSILLFDRNKYL